jgi:hypothetical protein
MALVNSAPTAIWGKKEFAAFDKNSSSEVFAWAKV